MKSNINIREKWKLELSTARDRSQRSIYTSKFKGLTADQASRASYFSEIAKTIGALGLANPHERSALSIEPSHPVAPKYIGNAIKNLNIDSSLATTYKQQKLSLVSLAMIENMTKNSDARKIRESQYNAPLHLLDPLYGFLFHRGKDRIHNHCLAIDIWSSHLSSMPRELAKSLWEKRADNMLSGGAFAGRFLFKDIIQLAQDNLERAQPPEIFVSSESELSSLIEAMQSLTSTHENVQLWFRGQNKEYLTPDRLDIAKRGITPYSNIRDADLTPSLYRNYESYLESTDSFEELVLELAEWVHWANHLAPKSSENGFTPPTRGVSAVTKEGMNSYQKGLILQQYGAPSAYLDITSDHSIAAWFATHKCSNNSESRMQYQKHQWNSENQEEWPTIFVFPLVRGLHPFLDLSSILKDTSALRAQRQKCGLLGGAGNLARNYCARYIGLKIRLKPGFKLSTPADPSYFFPPASEDKAFAFLQENGLGESKRHFVLSELT